MNEKLTWKEKLGAILLLIIGCFFLLTQVLDFISSKSDRFSISDNKVSVRMDQLLIDIKTYITIALAFLGGILLLKKKKLGWIIGLPVLAWYCILACGGIYMSALTGSTLPLIIFLAFCVVLLLASIVLLLLPTARVKYKVGKQTYLPTLVVLMAIIAMHFLLK